MVEYGEKWVKVGQMGDKGSLFILFLRTLLGSIEGMIRGKNVYRGTRKTFR